MVDLNPERLETARQLGLSPRPRPPPTSWTGRAAGTWSSTRPATRRPSRTGSAGSAKAGTFLQFGVADYATRVDDRAVPDLQPGDHHHRLDGGAAQLRAGGGAVRRPASSTRRSSSATGCRWTSTRRRWTSSRGRGPQDRGGAVVLPVRWKGASGAEAGGGRSVGAGSTRPGAAPGDRSLGRHRPRADHRHVASRGSPTPARGRTSTITHHGRRATACAAPGPPSSSPRWRRRPPAGHGPLDRRLQARQRTHGPRPPPQPPLTRTAARHPG